MAHAYGIYIRFDFGTDEEKAQQARHKLDGWRQAFRLDKRVQYKMDRPESAATEAGVAAYLLIAPAAAWFSVLFPVAADLSKTGTGGNYWRIGVTVDDGQTYYMNIGLR